MLLYIFIWWVDISKMPVDSDLNVGQKKYIQSVKVWYFLSFNPKREESFDDLPEEKRT